MTSVHITGEITLGAILAILTMLGSAGGFFVWVGRLATMLERVIKDSEKVREELASHNKEDQTTFRQIEGTLNQIVGQLQMVGHLQVRKFND